MRRLSLKSGPNVRPQELDGERIEVRQLESGRAQFASSAWLSSRQKVVARMRPLKPAAYLAAGGTSTLAMVPL